MIQTLINGLGIGGVYALASVGFVLIYQVSGVLNFAQGDLAMFSAYLGVTFSQMAHFPLWAACLLSLATMALVGVLFERIAYRPLQGKSIAVIIISTIAVGIILRNVALRVWGPNPYHFDSFISAAPVNIAGSSIDPRYILVFGAAVVLIGVQHLVVTQTRLGRKLQATSQDRQMAQLMGISTGRVVLIAFVVSTMLAAAAGLLVAPIFSVTTDMGYLIGLKAFVASVIGGFGSALGAAVAALGLGVLENLVATYGDPAYKDAVTFVLLIVVLLVLPKGIFGEPVGEKL